MLELSTFSRFINIGITSFGQGYNTAPELVVLDGTTGKKLDDIDLVYVLGSSDVLISKNTQTLSNISPTILPVNNPNGVRVRNLVHNATDNTVTATMQNIYSDSFPILVGDKVLVENSVVSVASTSNASIVTKGFNSQDYNYSLFTVIGTHESLGGNVGVVTYSFDALKTNEVLGTFDAENSAAILVPERTFPQFTFNFEPNTFQKGSVIKSGDKEGVVANWDETYEMITLESSSDFSVGDVIEEDVTGSKATVIKKYEFKTEYETDYFSLVDNGWRSDIGFLNKVEQRLPDNDYYQNFSYSIKSKVPFENWNNVVSSLLHSTGFKKFSDLQVESELPEVDEDSLSIVPTDATTIEVDLISVYDLECVSNFDYVTENYLGSYTFKFSDEITFKTRIISDFIESISNRVLLIDDISSQFDSNQRSTQFSNITRFPLATGLASKFVVLAKDRLFTGERMISLVTVMNDTHNGLTMINQYGDVNTQVDLGSYDYSIDGTDGLLQFFPTKFERNNYSLSIFSYNFDQLSGLTTLTGIGTTTIGISTGSGKPGSLLV